MEKKFYLHNYRMHSVPVKYKLEYCMLLMRYQNDWLVIYVLVDGCYIGTHSTEGRDVTQIPGVPHICQRGDEAVATKTWERATVNAAQNPETAGPRFCSVQTSGHGPNQ